MTSDIGEVSVSLRFMAKRLDFDAIDTATGLKPDIRRERGLRYRRPNGLFVEARADQWVKQCDRRCGDHLDILIQTMLNGGNDDLAGWQFISRDFDGQIFVGLMMAEGNEAFSLSPKTLSMVGSRGLHIEFDLYSPPADCDIDTT